MHLPRYIPEVNIPIPITVVSVVAIDSSKEGQRIKYLILNFMVLLY